MQIKKSRNPVFFITYLFLLEALTGSANNIAVTNAEITDRNDTDKYVTISFDLSWDNSFRTSTEGSNNNWDAVWIFLKYRVSDDTLSAWSHGTLSSSGHTMPSGYTYDLPADYKGIFIYRSSAGSGDTDITDVEIRWNYGGTGGDGVSNEDQVDIHLFGIEMVYVPQGSFYVGSGGDGNYNHTSEEYGSFTNGSWSSGVTIPFQITSEGSIELGGSAGKLWGTTPTSGFGGMGPAGTLPADYTKGYDAFYCMKYEITQGQYVDFLTI